MTGKENIRSECYNDVVVFSFALLFFVVVTTIGSMTIFGSRVDGMFNGLYLSLGIAIIGLYYFRGKFKLLTSFVQLVLNVLFTAATFIGVNFLLGDSELSEIAFGYIVVLGALISLTVLYKQLLDKIAFKLNFELLKKQPIKLN